MSTFIQRLTFLVVILVLGFLVFWFPGGSIIMGSYCRDTAIDGWDWIFSVFVPFYGLIVSMVC